MLFNIKNLSKKFGKNNVLKNINLEINKNEKIVLIGPSGSGKSTFLRCLNTLETPSSGEIYFHNELLDCQNEKNNSRKNWNGISKFSIIRKYDSNRKHNHSSNFK